MLTNNNDLRFNWKLQFEINRLCIIHSFTLPVCQKKRKKKKRKKETFTQRPVASEQWIHTVRIARCKSHCNNFILVVVCPMSYTQILLLLLLYIWFSPCVFQLNYSSLNTKIAKHCICTWCWFPCCNVSNFLWQFNHELCSDLYFHYIFPLFFPLLFFFFSLQCNGNGFMLFGFDSFRMLNTFAKCIELLYISFHILIKLN